MEPLLRVENLSMHFPIFGGVFRKKIGAVKAVTDVSFDIGQGETVGVVGESGCGKTTLGRTLVRLYDPSAGQIWFDGRNFGDLGRRELKAARREVQMIFQDPYASLNPRMSIREIIEEPLVLHRVGSKGQCLERVRELLELVGLPIDAMERFPHEFSGGQRQRICIARALALNPKLIIADEPVSALDVSIQSQVLNLLTELQERLGLTYIFISHDLAVVRHIASRIAVMYLGRIVELAPTSQLFDSPRHPYTKALLSSVPVPDPHYRKSHSVSFLDGDVPSPSNPPSGCAFHTRCPMATAICKKSIPVLESVESDGAHVAACHLKTMEKSHDH